MNWTLWQEKYPHTFLLAYEFYQKNPSIHKDVFLLRFLDAQKEPYHGDFATTRLKALEERLESNLTKIEEHDA